MSSTLNTTYKRKQESTTYRPQWTIRQVRQIHGLLLDLQTGKRKRKKSRSFNCYGLIRQRNVAMCFSVLIFSKWNRDIMSLYMMCYCGVDFKLATSNRHICVSIRVSNLIRGWDPKHCTDTNTHFFSLRLTLFFVNKGGQTLHLPLQHQEDGVPFGNLEESTVKLRFEFRWGHSISLQLWVSQLTLADTTTPKVTGIRKRTIVSQLTPN